MSVGERRNGQGQIKYRPATAGGCWVAYAPSKRNLPAQYIGRFAFRAQAEKAIQRWVEEHTK